MAGKKIESYIVEDDIVAEEHRVPQCTIDNLIRSPLRRATSKSRVHQQSVVHRDYCVPDRSHT